MRTLPHHPRITTLLPVLNVITFYFNYNVSLKLAYS